MKGKVNLFMVLAVLSPLATGARGLADIMTALENRECFESEASFSVSLPQSDNDVTYNIAMKSIKVDGDPLSPCDYLIDWSLDTPSGTVSGFSAYYDGHHYRYRDNRLQEYHVEWDSIPFLHNGNNEGVHRLAQFVDLLPSEIARQLRAMHDDSRYTLTIADGNNSVDGIQALKLESVMTVDGVVAMERDYFFDAKSLMPLRIDTESNPGSITEQTIYVKYTYPDNPSCAPINEAALMADYPEVFEKYRESNFRIENLASTPMPGFSLPTTTGERYTYHRGDAFRAPTLIVILDPTTGFNREIVDAVRGAAGQLPYDADIIYAFASNNVDMIEEVVPAILPGEHLLMSAKSLARDCGAASLPVMIAVDRSGVVRNVMLGFNNDMENVVLQNMALLR